MKDADSNLLKDNESGLSILLVDSDMSFDNEGGVDYYYSSEDITFEIKYSKLLEDLGYSYNRHLISFNQIESLPSLEEMKAYDAVIWVKGGQPTSDELISIENYLKKNGRLLMIQPAWEGRHGMWRSPCEPISFDFEYWKKNFGVTYCYLGRRGGDIHQEYILSIPSTIKSISGSILHFGTAYLKSLRQINPFSNVECWFSLLDKDAQPLIDFSKDEYPDHFKIENFSDCTSQYFDIPITIAWLPTKCSSLLVEMLYNMPILRNIKN